MAHLTFVVQRRDTPFTSCFFCTFPVEDQAYLLRDTKRNQNIGWICSHCVGRTPEEWQAMVGKKLTVARMHAHRLFTEATNMEERANFLESLLPELDASLVPGTKVAKGKISVQ